MKLSKLLLVAAVAGSALTANAAVWKNTRSWDLQEEKRYANWVTTMKSDRFASRTGFTNPLEQKTSMMDVPYFMRTVYSCMRGLPYMVVNKRDSRNPFNNSQDLWDVAGDETDGCNVKRLANFLSDTRKNLTWWGLIRDTFPLKASFEAIQPGVVYINYGTFSGDTSSKVVRILKTRNSVSAEMSFLTGSKNSVKPLKHRSNRIKNIPDGHAGFRAMNWTEVKSVAVMAEDRMAEKFSFKSHKGKFGKGDARFSARAQMQNKLEADPDAWHDTFLYRLQANMMDAKGVGSTKSATCADDTDVSCMTITTGQRRAQAATDLCLHVQERVRVVQDALDFLATQEAGFTMAPKSKVYNVYSTPSRDRRIKKHFRDLRHYRGNSKVERVIRNCVIRFDVKRPWKSLTLAQYEKRMKNGDIGNNPNMGLAQRWGE